MPHFLPTQDWFPRPVPGNVAVGEGSWIYSAFAFLHYRSARPCGVRIGRHSGLYIGTFFDLGPAGEVDIGDYCSIVGAILSTNGRISIGDYCFIAHEVVIADRPYAGPPSSEHGSDASVVTIGEAVWIGARVTIAGGVTIGEGAVVGAGSVVTSDVPAYTVVAGNPARAVRRLSNP